MELTEDVKGLKSALEGIEKLLQTVIATQDLIQQSLSTLLMRVDNLERVQIRQDPAPGVPWFSGQGTSTPTLYQQQPFSPAVCSGHNQTSSPSTPVSAVHCRQLTPAPLEFGLSPQAAHTPYQYQSIATGAIPQFSQSPHVPSLPTPDPDYTNQASSTLPVHDVHQVPSTSHHGENPGLPSSAIPVGCPAPLPLRNVGKEGRITLDSCEIQKGMLRSVDAVVCSSHHLCNAKKLPTLAVKLAKEAVFGNDVLKKCTVAGERGFPGLPVRELEELKRILLMQLPQFWNTPLQFEPIWKNCCDSIGQACKRLRACN